MKNNLIKIAGVIALIFSLQQVKAANNTSSSTHTSTKDSTVKMTVSSMECKTDSKMVETALYRKKGVKKVLIDGEILTITFDPVKIKIDDIVKTIENTGTCEDPNAKVHKVSFKTN